MSKWQMTDAASKRMVWEIVHDNHQTYTRIIKVLRGEGFKESHLSAFITWLDASGKYNSVVRIIALAATNEALDTRRQLATIKAGFEAIGMISDETIGDFIEEYNKD